MEGEIAVAPESPCSPDRLRPVIEEPPDVITHRDLAGIKEVMTLELVAAKKCRAFTKTCRLPEVQQEIDRIGKMHEEHYHRLLKYMESNPNQAYLGPEGRH